MALRKTFYSLFSTGSTQEDPFRHNLKIVDWGNVKTHQPKKDLPFVSFMNCFQTARIGYQHLWSFKSLL